MYQSIMETEVFDFDMESVSDSLNSLSDSSKDTEEDDLVESLLFNLDGEDDDFVIDNLATLIILTGASYLDICVITGAARATVYGIVGEACDAINACANPWLDNINFL